MCIHRELLTYTTVEMSFSPRQYSNGHDAVFLQIFIDHNTQSPLDISIEHDIKYNLYVLQTKQLY